MKFLKKLVALALVILVLSFGSYSSIQKALAATGGGTATIAVDGGAQGANVTVVQSTSHTFTTVLTIPGAGMTLGAASPTFTIPAGFTAPTTHAVANAGLVVADGQWSVAASGGGCAVDSSPVSATTVASGQVITVDITADCASGDTITLTYQGTSSVAMGATPLIVSTADAGDPGPVTPLIAGSPTITVTAALVPTPTPTSDPGSSSGGSSSSSSSSSSGGSSSCPAITTVPSILEARRLTATSIFVGWGPNAGLSNFIVQYGFQNGNWQFSANVSGFSTTINNLPAGQFIWVRVAATDGCSVGSYGTPVLVGGTAATNSVGFPNTGFPLLPNTGIGPLRSETSDRNLPWGVAVGVSSFVILYLVRTHKFLPKR